MEFNALVLYCEIGAVVKVVDSHLCGLGSIPGKTCGFFKVLCLTHTLLLEKGTVFSKF